MKVRFFCDFCDTVFDEAEIEEDALPEEIETLTGEEGRGIILQDPHGLGSYFLSVCPECNRDLGITDRDGFIFLHKPLMH